MIITELEIANCGEFSYKTNNKKGPNSYSANFPLFLIRKAWDKGCNFEAECDGYGAGEGTNGDWSGIRDSSDKATAVMLAKALNFLQLV